MLDWLKRLFGISTLDVRPRKFAGQVKRCVKAAQRKTGLSCEALKRVRIVRATRYVRSKSLRREVGVLENGATGDWGPGSIRAAMDANGFVPDEVLEHEAAHQIAHENGLGGALHCAEFRGKIWNW